MPRATPGSASVSRGPTSILAGPHQVSHAKAWLATSPLVCRATMSPWALVLDRCGGRSCGDHATGHADAAAVSRETIAKARSFGCVPHPVGQGFAGQAEHRALGERLFGPVRLNLAQGAGGWIEGTLSLKVPIFGVSASSGALVAGSRCGSERVIRLPGWELLA